LRGNQLAALSEVSRRITAALSIGDVVNSALQEARAVIAHDRVALWLRSEDGQTLHMAAALGYTSADVGEPEADLERHPLFGEVVSGRQPLIVAARYL
jgi:GAF domain-containing protein